MNSANGGDVIYRFKGDTSNLDKTTSSLKGLGTIGKTALVGISAASAAAVAGITTVMKKSISAYAEYEQLEGGIVSMMHGNQEAINKVLNTSKTAYKDLQMSQSQYLSSFESSFAIIQNGLGKNKDAIEYTNKTLQLSADLFNTFGGSTEQYSNAINWALKGTYSYLDNLNIGIKGTQEGFIEAANASGVLGRTIKDVKEVTNDEIIDVIQHYAEKAGAWGKSQQEASTTIIGSINMVKASFNDFLAGQGGISQVVESVVTAGKNLTKAFIKMAPDIIKGLVDLIMALVPMIPNVIQQLLPSLLQGVSDLINSLVNVLPQIILQIANMLPTLIPTIIDAIMKLIPVLLQNMPLFIKAGIQLMVGLATGLVNSIPTIIQYLPEIIEALISGLMEAVPLLMSMAPQITIALMKGMIKAIPTLVKSIPQIINAIVNGIKQGIGRIGNVGADLMKGLWNGISGLKNYVINKVKGMGKSIINGLKGALGIHSPSTEFAMIGKFSVLGYTEALDNMQKDIQNKVQETFGLSPQLTSSMNTHYSPNVVVNNNVDVSTDPLGQTVKRIKTFSGGAKNDYNYGMGV